MYSPYSRVFIWGTSGLLWCLPLVYYAIVAMRLDILHFYTAWCQTISVLCANYCGCFSVTQEVCDEENDRIYVFEYLRLIQERERFSRVFSDYILTNFGARSKLLTWPRLQSDRRCFLDPLHTTSAKRTRPHIRPLPDRPPFSRRCSISRRGPAFDLFRNISFGDHWSFYDIVCLGPNDEEALRNSILKLIGEES